MGHPRTHQVPVVLGAQHAGACSRMRRWEGGQKGHVWHGARGVSRAVVCCWTHKGPKPPAMQADYALKKAHPSSSAERAAHPLPYLHRCRKPRRPTAPQQCGGSCAAFEHAHVCTWGGFGGGLSPLGRLPPLTHVPGRLPSMEGVPRQGERWCPLEWLAGNQQKAWKGGTPRRALTGPGCRRLGT